MHVDMILEGNFIDTYYIQEYETQLRNQLFCIISNMIAINNIIAANNRMNRIVEELKQLKEVCAK